MIINKNEHAQDVTVYYSTDYPMIVVSYTEGQHKLFKKYKHMRDILREVPGMNKKV